MNSDISQKLILLWKKTKMNSFLKWCVEKTLLSLIFGDFEQKKSVGNFCIDSPKRSFCLIRTIFGRNEKLLREILFKNSSKIFFKITQDNANFIRQFPGIKITSWKCLYILDTLIIAHQTSNSSINDVFWWKCHQSYAIIWKKKL